MAGDSAETSNKSNKSFYSTVFVLFFIFKHFAKISLARYRTKLESYEIKKNY